MAAVRKGSRYGHRDATMILIAYRHGLRASEVCDLQWHQVELATGRLHVRRSKRGTSSVHPLQGDELRALRRLQREQLSWPHVFVSERGAPMAPKSFHAMIQRLGERAGMRPSRSIPTCCDTAAATSLRIRGTIPGRCKRGSGTVIFSTRCAIPNWRQIGSGTFGESEISKAPGIGRASVDRVL
jgi:integrase